MFEVILEKMRGDISTIRSMIRTNERLREILFEQDSINEQESENCQKIISLKEIVPSLNAWQIYENCSVVTRLYAIYENFVENLVRDWILRLPQIFINYSDLPKKIKEQHQIGVANLILELNKKNIKKMFIHLSVEQIIKDLFRGITGEHQYELVADAFIIHDQNLRKETLEQFLADAGIQNTWSWINNNSYIKKFSAEKKLKELIDYRNDAAHRGFIDAPLELEALLDLCDFVETLCQALAELVTYRVIEQQKSIGQVREIFIIH
jgi:hypothetical protein